MSRCLFQPPVPSISSTADSSVQRRFRDNVLRTDGFQQFYFPVAPVDAYQLFIQCNGKGWRHRAGPFHSIAHGWLFDGMGWNSERRCNFSRASAEKAPLASTRSSIWAGVKCRRMCQQLQFLFKVDGAYFEFDAAEALLHLFPDAPVHLVKVSHPDESVDGDALFAFAERGVPELQAACPEMQQGGFHSEQDGRMREQGFPVYFPPVLFQGSCRQWPTPRRMRDIVTTQGRERGTFTHAIVAAAGVGEEDVPYIPVYILWKYRPVA